MGRPLISLCVIARDEAARIRRCLTAAGVIADEIVVGDTGSTDATAELARRHGARVLDVPWTDDFAAARNATLDAARGEWILVVDADEVLESADAATVRAALRSSREPAYTVEIVSPRGPQGSEVAHVTRLFRNDPRHRYTGRIHEQILGSICRAAGYARWTPPRSGLRLCHDGYRPAERRAGAKLARNTRLLEREIAERPHDPVPRFLLARELAPRVGGDLLALPATRRAFALVEPAVEQFAEIGDRGLADAALSLAVRLATAIGRAAFAAEWSRRALALLGETSRLDYAEGERLLARARLGGADPLDAVERFERARRAPDGCESIPARAEMRTVWAPIRAAAALSLVDPERAERALLAIDSTSEQVERLLALAGLRAMRGRPDRAIPLLAEAVRREPEDPRCWWSLGAALGAAGDASRAREMFATAARAAPDWDALPVNGSPLPEPPAGLLGVWAHRVDPVLA